MVGSGGSESPLASKLQQAWLDSQRPKFQRQSTAAAGERINSSVTAARINQPSTADSAELHNGSQFKLGGMQTSNSDELNEESIFPHKRRLDLPVFPKREVPQLVSYSRLSEPPRGSPSLDTSSTKSSAPVFAAGAKFSPNSGIVSGSSLISNACNDDPIRVVDDDVDAARKNCEDMELPISDGDLVDSSPEQTANLSMNSLESVLMDESMEDEMYMLQGGSAYLAMAKDLAQLIHQPAAEARSSEASTSTSTSGSLGNNSWAEAEINYDESYRTINNNDDAPKFVVRPPPAESVEDELLRLFACRLGNQVMDESENIAGSEVGPSVWMDNALTDTSLDYEDELWNSSLWNSSFGGMPPSVSTSSETNTTSTCNPPSIDLINLLLRCAHAVSRDDGRLANDLIDELRQHSSAYGNVHQRLAHYYTTALVAKMSGAGADLCLAMSNNHPSTATMLRAQGHFYINSCPYNTITHCLSVKTILAAFAGAIRVHIIDFGIQHGFQWASLIQNLADRPEGPPHLRITGIDLPQLVGNPLSRVEGSGHRLAKFAEKLGVPFEYHGLAQRFEEITPAKLSLRDDEVLAVTCHYRLHYLMDESVAATNPRKSVLTTIRQLNPKVFVLGVISAGHNAPFFMARFRESIKHYVTMFDAIDDAMLSDDPGRVLIEREIYGREILNIVACEGQERVERATPYKQWHSLTEKVGFTQMPLKPKIVSRIKHLLATRPEGYGVAEDGGWFLMGWKNHVVQCVSAWEPSPQRSFLTYKK